jgi:hypothetical protein
MEALIDLIFENFGEQCNRRILLIVSAVMYIKLDRIDDGGCPFYNQVFEAVFLHQVSVHKLLHSFDRLA